MYIKKDCIGRTKKNIVNQKRQYLNFYFDEASISSSDNQ